MLQELYIHLSLCPVMGLFVLESMGMQLLPKGLVTFFQSTFQMGMDNGFFPLRQLRLFPQLVGRSEFGLHSDRPVHIQVLGTGVVLIDEDVTDVV